MATLWLPFYDLGASLGVGQPNHALDIKLFSFLTAKVLKKLGGKFSPPPVTASHRGTGIEKPPTTETIAWWLNWAGAPSKPNAVVQPAILGSQSLMRKLNQAYCAHYPDEFPNASFSLVDNFQLNLANLPGHMALANCCRSAWLGLTGNASGPSRELPYYNTTAAFGQNCPNLASDTALISVLIKTIQGGLPFFFKNFSLGPNAIVGPGAVVHVANAVAQAGWPCSPTETVIQPDSPGASSSSLMRALNHFAFQANRSKYISLAGAPSSVLSSALSHDFQASRLSKFW